MGRAARLFLLVWIALLLAGTLKLGVLTGSWLQFELPVPAAQAWQAGLDQLVPFDAAKGEEGVSVQGVLLIGLLLAIGLSAWRGIENIQNGANRWTGISLALIAVTLLLAALAIQATPTGLRIGVTGKFFGVALALAALLQIGRRHMSEDELQDWLWESWRFVKQIFPLLVAGVFIVGMVRVLIRPEWIESLAGANTLQGNLAGVAFGVFMYFPTLVEVPIARMFLDLGMHRGPLLAYLMADPELSLQSILIISAIIGRPRPGPTWRWWPCSAPSPGSPTAPGWTAPRSCWRWGWPASSRRWRRCCRWPAAGKPLQSKESDHAEHQGSRPRLRQLPETRGDRPRSRGRPRRRGGDQQGHRHAADHRLRRAEDARAGDQREAGVVRRIPTPQTVAEWIRAAG
jgi:uncharacterized membrane protein YraQ (UPF0718 family)